MWPFTSQRIFGNRWWAIGFVLFICWQVSLMFDQPNGTAGNNATATDISGAPVDDAQLRDMANTLNSLQKID